MLLRCLVAGLLVAAACGSSDVAAGIDASAVIDAPAGGADATPGGDGAIDAGRPGIDAGRTGDGGGVITSDGSIFPESDGGLRDCNPSGTCSSGPMCGIRCCQEGEWCDPSTDTCHCGSGAACMAGDMCAAAGPVGPPACGIICCGSSGPCPL